MRRRKSQEAPIRRRKVDVDESRETALVLAKLDLATQVYQSKVERVESRLQELEEAMRQRKSGDA